MKDNSELNKSEIIKLTENPDHLKYVWKIAWSYFKRIPEDKRGMLTIDDLISAGYEGLVLAAGMYDPEHKSGAKFTSYSANWIKGEIRREIVFYIGKDALLLDNEEAQIYVPGESDAEDTVTGRDIISEIPEEERVKIIEKKLKKWDLTKDEITVFLAVNGIGCSKVTNLRTLAKQVKKREIEIKRIKQSAEDKVEKSLGGTGERRK